jgi:hypothetical protein
MKKKLFTAKYPKILAVGVVALGVALGAASVTEAGSSGVATGCLRGNLSGSRPLIGNPSATATSTTFQGACNLNSPNRWNIRQIEANLTVNNNGTGTATTGWRRQENTSQASSGSLRASTRSASFTGNHRARNSTNGTWTNTNNTSISW